MSLVGLLKASSAWQRGCESEESQLSLKLDDPTFGGTLLPLHSFAGSGTYVRLFSGELPLSPILLELA